MAGSHFTYMQWVLPSASLSKAGRCDTLISLVQGLPITYMVWHGPYCKCVYHAPAQPSAGGATAAASGASAADCMENVRSRRCGALRQSGMWLALNPAVLVRSSIQKQRACLQSRSKHQRLPWHARRSQRARTRQTPQAAAFEDHSCRRRAAHRVAARVFGAPAWRLYCAKSWRLYNGSRLAKGRRQWEYMLYQELAKRESPL